VREDLSQVYEEKTLGAERGGLVQEGLFPPTLLCLLHLLFYPLLSLLYLLLHLLFYLLPLLLHPLFHFLAALLYFLLRPLLKVLLDPSARRRAGYRDEGGGEEDG
jgi:hypothetical protein